MRSLGKLEEMDGGVGGGGVDRNGHIVGGVRG